MTDRDASPTRESTKLSKVRFTGRIMQVLYSSDPAGMPWERDALEALDLVGTPICILPPKERSLGDWCVFGGPKWIEHAEQIKVGEVTKNYVDELGYMWIEAEVLVPHDFKYRELSTCLVNRMGKDRGLLPLTKVVKYVSLCQASWSRNSTVQTWETL